MSIRHGRVGNGKRGAVKGVPIYKTFSLPPRCVPVYYRIQDFIRQNGRGPYYYEVGRWLGGSENYYTCRNKGIKVVALLEEAGFVERVGEGRLSQIKLTAKPFTDVTLVIPTDSKPRHKVW